MVDSTPTFSFESLKNGALGISAAYGSFLAEAASYCLHLRKHSNPVRLLLTGNYSSSGVFQWDNTAGGLSRTYADLQEGTEYGACAIAIVVAVHLIGIAHVERSAKGTGIDYWLGQGNEETGIFQRAARLEVSGIFEGSESKISARLKKKLSQTARSDRTLLPAYIAIVEFGSPETRLVKNDPQETDL
jgi:hypothetical protein